VEEGREKDWGGEKLEVEGKGEEGKERGGWKEKGVVGGHTQMLRLPGLTPLLGCTGNRQRPSIKCDIYTA